MRRQSPLLQGFIEAQPMTAAQRTYAEQLGRQAAALAMRAQQLAAALDALPALAVESEPLRTAAAVLGAYAAALAHVHGELRPDVDSSLAGARSPASSPASGRRSAPASRPQSIASRRLAGAAAPAS